MLTSQELPHNRTHAIRPESEELRRLLQSYAETYQPQNEAERTLVRQFALATIRLRRLEQVEDRLWQQDEPDLRQITQCEGVRASAERSFFRCYQTLEKLRKECNITNPKSQPRAVPRPEAQIKPAPKRDIQSELDAILGRPQSLADIDAILANRSPLKTGQKEGLR